MSSDPFQYLDLVLKRLASVLVLFFEFSEVHRVVDQRMHIRLFVLDGLHLRQDLLVRQLNLIRLSCLFSLP